MTLPDEDANHPLPKNMPLNELLQKTADHVQSKKALRRPKLKERPLEIVIVCFSIIIIFYYVSLNHGIIN